MKKQRKAGEEKHPSVHSSVQASKKMRYGYGHTMSSFQLATREK